MTLEEAIKLSKVAAEDMDAQDMPQFAKATRLGREALKREKKYRVNHPDVAPYLLPGETEE